MGGNYGYENKNLLEGFTIEETASTQLSYLNKRGAINCNLDLNHKLNVRLISSLNIQDINENYIICTDAWDEIRGLPTIFSLWFSALLAVFIVSQFYIIPALFDERGFSFFLYLYFLYYLLKYLFYIKSLQYHLNVKFLVIDVC